ncbi:uncharacterized protein [Littorina saxatilis]|uniref:Uncharacterized protein n=1 Tax=Littorina saxatilis TaxID=31220 RepID=A0AAN9G9M0_9CAEN
MEWKLGKAGNGGLICFGLGAFLFIVGFSIANWVTLDDSDYRAGLWRYCGESLCRKVSSSSFKFFGNSLPAWFQFTQGFACLAVITLICDGIARGLFVFCDQPKAYLWASIGLDVATAVLAFSAAALFGAHVEEDKFMDMSLSWGFALDIIGGILISFAAACFLAETRIHF